MARAEVDAFNNTTVNSLESLHRLLNKQDKDAELVRYKQKQMTKFKEDYQALYSRLSTITDKVSHEVFVPMGRLAFFPGRVKHTNEILVLLGENWFVESSAKQAREIVQRRITQCEETLKGFEKELRLLGDWSDKTKSLQQDLEATQGVNIIEREESGWREEHQRKVREYRQKLAEQKKLDEAEARHPRTDEEELWRRLDELDLQEELQHELDLLGENDEELNNTDSEAEEDESVKEEEQQMEWNGGIIEPQEDVEKLEKEDRDAKSRRVTWCQEDSVRKFHRDDVPFNASRPTPDETKVSGDDGEETALKITFKHSKNSTRGGPIKLIPPSDESSTAPVFPTSPSDIYRQFGGQPDAPKSILKVKKCTTPVNMIEQIKAESNTATETNRYPTGCKVTAMSEEVKERGTSVDAIIDGASTTPERPDDEVVNTHRPVSRFRAARLRNNLPNL